MSTERRVPTQARSREKYEHILSAAKELIGEKGNDSVSMREISKSSGVALASIYQYFPDKNAIIQDLMQGYFDRIRAMIIGLMDSCETVGEVSANMLKGLDAFYALFLNDPALAALWSGVQASKELKELDANDSQMNADIITKKICSIVDDLDEEQAYDAIFLLIYMTGVSVRLALTVPEAQGVRLMDELKRLIVLRIESLV